MKLGTLLFALLFVPLVSAAMDPYVPYCEHMGYTMEGSDCVFDDGNRCPIAGFFDGACGSEYVKEFPCVQNGEPVFEYEDCCDGVPYIERGMIGQSKCVPKSEVAGDNMGSIVMGIALIVGAVIAVVWMIYGLKKKKTKKAPEKEKIEL